MKKIIISLMCVALLTGCVAATDNKGKTTTETSTSQLAESTETTANYTGTNVAQTTVKANNVNLNQYSNEKVVWGPGRGNNHSRPSEPVSLQKKYADMNADFIMNDEKLICLTFDEGYENGYTPAILDTLKEKGVKAVFFVTYDFAKNNPKLIERMIDEGHTIGNHSYRHYTLDEVSEETALQEITFLDEYMKKTHKYRMTLFRFPKGEFSERTLALADSTGYKSVFWSFAYADWDVNNQTDTQTALKTITDNFHNGEIMLLHAVSSTNAKILGDVIDEAQKQGYEFTVKI